VARDIVINEISDKLNRVSNNVSPDLIVIDKNSSKSLKQKQNQSLEQIDETKNSEQIGQAAACK